ncbi:hypothetical protein BCR44DRAFT_1037724 [Catenaria anguillulae PL171]|uniref:Uncharacterized protein n=1 Tax=Catenaria anguillulae PL171 TaxID=765915 RepID=A0A1Y2H7D4_9FUNG|nr:hypothetical protein BCR44DRAFT_1037724 [Catenaria anguillulae PL171]
MFIPSAVNYTLYFLWSVLTTRALIVCQEAFCLFPHHLRQVHQATGPFPPENISLKPILRIETNHRANCFSAQLDLSRQHMLILYMLVTSYVAQEGVTKPILTRHGFLESSRAFRPLCGSVVFALLLIILMCLAVHRRARLCLWQKILIKPKQISPDNK